MMLALCPGKHQHQLSHWAGEAWAMEDPGQGGPLPLLRHVVGAGRGGWGAPSGQHQGVQHRIGTASLGTGAEVLRGQLRASVASHALWVQGWRPGSEQGQS